jgi:hypothetical protein
MLQEESLRMGRYHGIVTNIFFTTLQSHVMILEHILKVTVFYPVTDICIVELCFSCVLMKTLLPEIKISTALLYTAQDKTDGQTEIFLE